MAKQKKDDIVDMIDIGDDIHRELKEAINKQVAGSAFILGDDDTPTDVNEWISTGSYQLDSLISNRPDVGGFPVGRISEVSGFESSGKSLIAIEACKDTQKKGGIVVYIDTESATSIPFLENMGIDPRRLVYVQVPTTEEVFETVQAVVDKIREKYKGKKKKPIITIIWDSVAQTSTLAEVEGEFSDQQYASQAKVIGKALRKTVQYLAASNVCFIALNQLKYKIGVVFGNPLTTTGGMALRYACSVRVELTRSKKIEANEKAIIGYETKAKIVKNKVGPPGGECTFDIYFNRGVSDDEQTLKFLKKNNLIDEITSQRSALQLADGSKIEFKNKEFDAVFGQHADYIKGLVKASLVVDLTNPELSTTRVEVSDFITNGGEKIDPETGEILTSRKKKEVLVDID